MFIRKWKYYELVDRVEKLEDRVNNLGHLHNEKEVEFVNGSKLYSFHHDKNEVTSEKLGVSVTLQDIVDLFLDNKTIKCNGVYNVNIIDNKLVVNADIKENECCP